MSRGTITIEGNRTKNIATCALCVALLCASVFFTVPIGPVPFTLQTAVVILIALLMSPKHAAATTAIYLLIGIVGFPVFSGPSGGLGKFLGPTCGFLASYLIGTFLASAVRTALENRGLKQIACDVICAALIIICSDLLGWLWFMVATGTDPLAAFLAADAPFIVIDCCKAALSIIVATAVRKALKAN